MHAGVRPREGGRGPSVAAVSVRRSVLARHQLARLRDPAALSLLADITCEECGLIAKRVPEGRHDAVADEHVLTEHHPGVSYSYPYGSNGD